MTARRLRRGVAVVAGLALAALACFEEPTSPAQCPEFCPGGGMTVVESLLETAVERDTSFQGYIQSHATGVLLAVSEPTLESRPIFETLAIPTRFRIDTGSDTTTGPIVADSMRLTLTVFRRNARNLRLAFYQLPLGIDSTSTFAALDPAFGGTPMRTVNLDTLLAQSAGVDTLTGDSVLAVDSAGRFASVRLVFSTAQAPFSEADSGKLAIGVRITADSLASVALGSQEAGTGPTITWFYGVDSAGVIIHADSAHKTLSPSQSRGLRFDGFVDNAPPVTIDQDLTIGGVPSTRALLRINLPRRLLDSTRIIRAVLQLTPTASGALATPDSVFLDARPLVTDVGAKSPSAGDTLARSRPFQGLPGDTVRVELTNMFRTWQGDTAAVTAFFLRLLALQRDSLNHVSGTEAGTLDVVRFFSSRTTAFRPSILLTFVPRVKFGAP